MKADSRHLEETDGLIIDDDARRNWLMFTPNDLLKIYLKEAMNKEGLSATDHFVTTWDRERTILARDVLRFLKRGDKGYFTRLQTSLLTETSSASLSRISREFTRYHNTLIVTSFNSAIEDLIARDVPATAIRKEVYPLIEQFRELVRSMKNVAERQGESQNAIALTARIIPLVSTLKELRNGLVGLVEAFLNRWIGTYPDKFRDLTEYVSGDAAEPVGDMDDDPEESEEAEEEVDESQDLSDPLLKTRNFMKRAVLAGLRKKSIRNPRTRFVWEYMEVDRSQEPDLDVVGNLLPGLRHSGLRILGFNALLRLVPGQYQQYRVSELENNVGAFQPQADVAIKERKISSDEIDLLIFIQLQIVREILDRYKNIADPELGRGILGNILQQFRTQIAVDEATDFSAIQLVAMYYLTEPGYRSITYSGDLMQRVTAGGLSSWSELMELLPSAERYDLYASYRQTPVLLELAKKLYETIIGEPAPFTSKYEGESVFPPPLKYYGKRGEELGKWIADRVYEIYRINGETLPSIAVFVPTENDIDSVARLLKDSLNEFSIDAQACSEGQILGTGSNVRVFSIEYIKGLEFEGVFYVDIDAVGKRDLIDKYLYVGLTRATTFLGITYSTALPPSLQFLNNDFDEGDWTGFLS